MPNLLTSLSRLKVYAHIEDTDSDAILYRLIEQMTEVITKECGRESFFAGTFTEYLDGASKRVNLFLRNTPITAVTSIHDDEDRVWPASSLIASTDYRFDSSGVISLDTEINSGFGNVKIIYTGGYTTIPRDLELACQMKVYAAYLTVTVKNHAPQNELPKTDLATSLNEQASAIIDKYKILVYG